MQTIGERLQEARKKKNITIREAAEATKIRGEFLAYFEDNHFDINLPEIYCKGFVKLYAKYLGLDAEQIGVDYNAYKMGSVRVSHSPRREHTPNQQGQFGYIELDDIPAPSPAAPAPSTSQDASSPSFIQKAASRIPFAKTQDTPQKKTSQQKPSSIEDFETFNDKSTYLKIAAVLGATVVAVLLLILIVKVIGSSSSSNTPSPVATENRIISTFPQTLRFTNKGSSGYFNIGIKPLNDDQATSQGFRLHAQQPVSQSLSYPVQIGLMRVPNATTPGPYRLTITRDDGREATITFNNSAILHYDGELILVKEDSLRPNRVITWE
jgi:transcriptional regulator with XRE-family HTH domain